MEETKKLEYKASIQVMRTKDCMNAALKDMMNIKQTPKYIRNIKQASKDMRAKD